MPLVLRSVKGSKLTIAEMDGNLVYLESLALSGATSGTTSPAGSNSQVQYNDNGVLGADSGFTYDKSTQNLGVTSVSASNYVSGAMFASPTLIETNQTVPLNHNAMMVGPTVALADGVTLHVPVSSTLAILPVMTNGVPTVTTDTYQTYWNGSVEISATVTTDGGHSITEKGIVWSTSPHPTVNDNKEVDAGNMVGPFTMNFGGLPFNLLCYFRAFATNINGTSYGNQLSFTPFVPCLAKGTKITLWGGATKNIEDVDYNDELLVWNFDIGLFDKAKPLWIGFPSRSSFFSRVKFSNGAVLDSVIPHLGHRIMDVEKGRFSYPMSECGTGTITFSEDHSAPSVTESSIIYEEGTFYNIITERHLNMFANGILTSCRWNNIYPINKMRFVKDDRQLRSYEEFQGLDRIYYDGLRASEQLCDASEIVNYMKIRETYKKPEFEGAIS